MDQTGPGLSLFRKRPQQLIQRMNLPATALAEERYGVLIGVSEYPNLVGRDLKGPKNDVRLMFDTLNRKSFKAANLFVVAVASAFLATCAAADGQAPPPLLLSETVRSHVRDERFQIVTSVPATTSSVQACEPGSFVA